MQDSEPYPCLPRPVRGPLEELLGAGGRRSKRSLFYRPPDHKNDVYSVFKVPNRPGALGRDEGGRPPVKFGSFFFFPLQEVGMKLLTNAEVKKPYDCLERFPSYALYDGTSGTCSFLLWFGGGPPNPTVPPHPQ